MSRMLDVEAESNSRLRSTMRLEVLNSQADHENIKRDWIRLGGHHPFLNWAWQSRWWEAFGESHQRLTIVIRDCKEDVVAIAPFYLEQHWVKGNVIRWVGSGRACSDWMTLLADPDHARRAAETISEWLAGEGSYSVEPPIWNMLELDGVIGGDIAADGLTQDLQFHNCSIDEHVPMSVWRVELERDFETFVSKRVKSSNRRKFRRPMKDWIESGRSEYKEATSDEERRATFDLLRELHERRRSQLGEVGCFGETRFDSFMRNLIEDYAEFGRLRLGQLEVDGKAIACCLGFSFDNTFYVYQSGIDPDSLDLGPGFLMYSHIIQQEMQRGTKSLDFLRGDERYKKEFGCQPQPCRLIRVYGADRVSVARHRISQAKESLKRWVKGFRPAT